MSGWNLDWATIISFQILSNSSFNKHPNMDAIKSEIFTASQNNLTHRPTYKRRGMMK
jgi:hypothetical protein